MTERVVLISPQAGLGNRLRAIAAAVAITLRRGDLLQCDPEGNQVMGAS